MSTHRITDQTKIPFPCWLWYSKDRCWDWVYDSGGMAKHDTHYSTNPLDQRPGDVVPTIAEAASTPEAAEKLVEKFWNTQRADPLAIAREAAAQIFITTATLPGKVEKAESIIHRAIEQATAALRAELEKAKSDADLQRTRLSAILWSGALDKHTAGEVQEWTGKYLAELTALRRDKERMDWMEAQADPSHKCVSLNFPRFTGMWSPPLRDAIDAAMEGQP